jgi:hypothetical protein
MQFSGITKVQDLVAVQLYFYKSNPTLKRNTQLHRIIFPVVIGGFALILIVLQGITVLSVLYLFIAILAYFWIPKFTENRVKLYARKLAETSMKKFLGKYTVELSEEAITHFSDTGEQKIFWKSVEKPIFENNYLFIVIGGASALAIDCNDHSKEEIQSLVNFVENQIAKQSIA